MADKKITQLTNITGANLVDADEFVVVDISADETKAITLGELKEAFDSGSGFVRTTGDTMTGDLALSGADVTFGDNDKAIFGAGSDLEIYHDGTDSIIKESGSGDLQLWGNDIRLMSADGTETMLRGNPDAQIQLYYDNAVKLATTSTGVDITGTLTSDGLTVDGTTGVTISGAYPMINFGETDTTDQNSRVRVSAGDFRIDTVNDAYGSGKTRFLMDNATGDISFYDSLGSSQSFFWDASAESLGIGTSSPSALLDVVSSTSPIIKVRSDNVSTGSNLIVDGGSSNDSTIALLSSGTYTYGLFRDGSQSNDLRLLSYTDTAGATDILRYGINGSLEFGTNGTERMRIDSSGNVGIGTASPNVRAEISGTDAAVSLRVNSANVGVSASNYSQIQLSDNDAVRSYWRNVRDGSGATHFAYGDHLAFLSDAGGTPTERMRIDSSGNVNLTGLSNGTLNFAGGNTSGGSKIQAWNDAGNANGYLAIEGYSSEYMRLDSSGNLLVGKTSADNTTAGTTIYAGTGTGNMSLVRNGGSSLVMNRLNSDGEIAVFRKDGSTVGSIGSRLGANLVITSPTATYFDSAIRPLTDNTKDIGTSSLRFKDLYLSGGLRGDTTFKNNAGTTEYARFDGSGNLLVGKTVTTLNTEGHVLTPTYARFTRDGAAPVQFNRTTSDGDITIFYKDGSTVGSIGTASGNLSIDTNNKAGLLLAGNVILPKNNGAISDGTVDLGRDDPYRFKDLYLSGGVYLGGTGAANKLDDYEEGNWTPVYSGTSVTGTGTYTRQSGVYVKVGDLVYASCTIGISAHTGSGNAEVTGLPYAAFNSVGNYAGISVSFNSGHTTTSGYQIIGFVQVNTAGIKLWETGGTGQQNPLSLDTSFTEFDFSIMYRTT